MRNSKRGLLALSVFVAAMGIAPLVYAEGAGQYMDDAAITAKVKASLLSNTRLKATDVSVETTQGVVQLTGAVNSKDQENEAVSTTNKINGVKSVKDLLIVKPAQEE